MSQSAKGLRVLSSSGLVISKIANRGKKFSYQFFFLYNVDLSLVLPLGVMKDISLGWPRFEPPSNRCYTNWYIPLCSAQSVGFIASSLFFVCVQIETKHGKQKKTAAQCVTMSLCFQYVLPRWETVFKRLLCFNVSKNRSHSRRSVTLEQCELNWSVCM